MKLKPIDQQVVVVMGASSGIGRETALRFARQGAKVVVSAHGEAGLASLVDEVRREGGEATAIPADVAEFAQVKAVADGAVATNGRLDTWVHCAAVSLYARVEDTTPEEFKRVVDVTFMGHVHGAMAALSHLKQTGQGALIHVSSIEARRAFPLSAAYAAAKHAIDGFLESLRVELRHDHVPVSVTQILPASINTPLFNNARTKLGVKAQVGATAGADRAEGDKHVATQDEGDRPGNGSAEGAVRSDVAAVLFDLDRTLIGGETAHLARLVALLQNRFDRAPERDTEAGAGRATGPIVHCYAMLCRRVVLTPDARRVLAALERAGIPYGIVTNGRARKRHTLRLLGLERRAACVVVSGEHGCRKPDSALFQRAADALGAPPERILFVGDDPRRDVRGARAAGMRAAWLRRQRIWPWSRPSADAADAALASLGDVLSILGLAAV